MYGNSRGEEEKRGPQTSLGVNGGDLSLDMRDQGVVILEGGDGREGRAAGHRRVQPTAMWERKKERKERELTAPS